MDFPRTVDEITPAWLTQVLRQSGAIGGNTVRSIETSNIGADQGLQGDVSRISIAYANQESSTPESVVVKLSLADDERRAQLNNLGASEREVWFYNELAADAGISIPGVYFSKFDTESGHMNIVQEDVGRFRVVDQSDDCSFDDAITALTGLAQMHARWWNSDQLSNYPWLGGPANSDRFKNMTDAYNERLEGCFEALGEWLPAGFESLARKYQSKLAEVAMKNSRGALTLTHGDYRTGNLVFDDTGSSGSRMIAFDWAGVSRAKAAGEIGYFMSLNFGIDSRRHNESRLLAEYHSRLVDFGVSKYTFDEFMEDARWGLFVVVFTAVMASANISKMTETEAGRKRVAALVERLQIVIDWNIEELLAR